ncbi:MAG: flagellar export chaperone FlgN [Clostridia bacterium]|nr:flagellar export chaperone FlgN [Clostridia bacterium]
MLEIENVMETLIGLSEEKYGSLEKIYEFTKEQTTAIDDENIELLNDFIDKKQIEINSIKALDIKFEKIVDDIKVVYGIKELKELNVCTEEVKRIQYIVDMIMKKVKQIHDIELKNSESLSKKKNAVESKIKDLKKGKKVVSNYGYNNLQNPVYFDKNR